MIKKSKRVETLSGLFLPFSWRLFKAVIEESKYISDSTKALCFDEIVDVEFILNRGDRVKVYYVFIRAIINGWLAVTQLELAIYLAEHSNLATNPDIGKRITTIQHFLTIYKNVLSA